MLNADRINEIHRLYHGEHWSLRKIARYFIWHAKPSGSCAPPHLVGQRLIIKADASSVALYHRNQEIARYPRCWQRGQTLGTERFEKELLAHRAAAQRSKAQRRLIALLAGDCAQETVEAHLRGLADSNRALSRQITELLQLIRQYTPKL